jgi:hypothetical protein
MHQDKFMMKFEDVSEKGSQVFSEPSLQPATKPALENARSWFPSGQPSPAIPDEKLSDSRSWPKIVLYSHDTFGMGNIRRTLLLSQEFITIYPGASILIITGSPMIHAFRNISGFTNILEACRRFPVKHLIYTSSSSVYGANKKLPFSVQDNVDHPISLYAASKKANELMAHAYSHLFKIPTTGLRFFTVYGPWGRPDMAVFTFTKAILEDTPIKIFNYGKMRRDFTYIDDIVEGVLQSLRPPSSSKLRGNRHRTKSEFRTVQAVQHRKQPASPVVESH